MYGQRRWTVPAPLSIKLVSTTVCKIVTEMCVVVSSRSYAVRSPPRVRQQYTVKSPLLLSTFFLISLYHHHHHHQSILPKGRFFTASTGTYAAVQPKAGLPPETQEPMLQFYQDEIGAVTSRCFPHPTLSLAPDHTLKDLKRSQGLQRGGEESEFD